MRPPWLRPKVTTDLDTSSRGIPADWVIHRGAVRVGHVTCPDEHTALILAVFRYGADVTVRRQGARS